PAPAPPQHEAVQRGRVIDVLANAEVRVQAEQLGHVAHPFAGPPRERVGPLPEHLDGPLGRAERAGDHADRGGLAGSGRTDEAHHLAGMDLEIEPVDGGRPVEASRDTGHANGDRLFDGGVSFTHAGGSCARPRCSVPARRLQADPRPVAGGDARVAAAGLPAIVVDLADWTELRAASWIINGYLLVSIVVMPLAGQLADRHGVRPVFLAALAVFVAGSILAGR